MFFFNLFIGALRNSGYVVLNDWMLGNNELERMRKREVMA